MLQNEIDTLAKQHGGRSVPAHLTLMGGIVDTLEGAEERAKLLSGQLKVEVLARQLKDSLELLKLHTWHHGHSAGGEERANLLSSQLKVRLRAESKACS